MDDKIACTHSNGVVGFPNISSIRLCTCGGTLASVIGFLFNIVRLASVASMIRVLGAMVRFRLDGRLDL